MTMTNWLRLSLSISDNVRSAEDGRAQWWRLCYAEESRPPQQKILQMEKSRDKLDFGHGYADYKFTQSGNVNGYPDTAANLSDFQTFIWTYSSSLFLQNKIERWFNAKGAHHWQYYNNVYDIKIYSSSLFKSNSRMYYKDTRNVISCKQVTK